VGAAGPPGSSGSIPFSVIAYGGNAGGSVDNSAAVTAACAANSEVYFPVGTYNFTANYTVPCATAYQAGAALKAPNGVAVNMNLQHISASNYQQIFLTAGTGAFTGLTGEVPAEWFGVFGFTTKAAAAAGPDNTDTVTVRLLSSIPHANHQRI
jgi:hypothetical protein